VGRADAPAHEVLDGPPPLERLELERDAAAVAAPPEPPPRAAEKPLREREAPGPGQDKSDSMSL